ncbi:N-acetylgalactosamine kinase [Temnothorax longispinosus]|uniref:N-acetylgalactosamine kinase n=1 Tax=Temnothorax longispinosus TaxID=300112 RepID=A0A4V3SC28_9HYME|nr:N-acetylgalactosamine kinase [Temnothorax longispinosus]
MSHIAMDVDMNSEDSEDSEEDIYASTREPVPILAPSADILPRLKTLAAHFTSKYNVGPSFFVRVPGRVNLIGEHIDYCGYAVLPMAIEQNILIAYATTKDNEIHLTNVDPKYKDFRCSFENVGSCISDDSESGSAWYKYFLCGVKETVEMMDRFRLPPRMRPKGILAAVWGNIIPNSGLSSSSALVSATFLSVIHSNKRHFATFSARAEKHIGTQGGGMDQTVAFSAKAGNAKLIEFFSNNGELSHRASDVTLTEGAVFVIAHSQAYHNKASTADYNLRVAECRLAAQMIAEKRNIKEIFKSYAHQESCTYSWNMGPNMDSNMECAQRLITIQETLRLDLDEMVTVVMTELHEEPNGSNNPPRAIVASMASRTPGNSDSFDGVLYLVKRQIDKKPVTVHESEYAGKTHHVLIRLINGDKASRYSVDRRELPQNERTADNSTAGAAIVARKQLCARALASPVSRRYYELLEMSHIAIVDKEENIGDSIKDYVPILAPSADILPRLKTLAAHFTSKYNVEPSFFVRVPGRVNLIGEHIDYCGYAVLPMAIEQNILIAVATSKDNEIHLTNVDPKYKDFRCSFENVESCISDSESGSAWYKYFLCGVKGALEAIPATSVPTGILAAVWGNIPPNSGLSSSSALVSAALLSVIHASQRELATLSARAERHIGTQGGGMDQAIAFLAKAGKAKLIEFPSDEPLRATDVTLTESAVFVIAHSQAYHNKASTADYNLRVAECRLAAQMIAKKRNMKEIFKSYVYRSNMGPNMDSSMDSSMDSNMDPNMDWSKYWESVQSLMAIQEILRLDLDEMVTVVMTELHEEPYTIDEICESLGMNYEQLKKRTPLVKAGRVRAFCRINKENPRYDTCRGDKTLQELGNLMSESHTTILVWMRSSKGPCFAVHLALDSQEQGNWGGCIVALVDKNRVQQFVENLREYLCQNSTKDRAELEDIVFPTSPNDGAVIYTVPTL